MEGKRIDYIDSLKGFAIILVVIGHVIQYYYCPTDFDNNILFRCIYSFHMPLFFIISGFVSYFSTNQFLSWKCISKNSVQLMVPFLSWALLNWLVFGNYSLLDVIKRPDCGLWFLWSLFWVRFFFLVSSSVNKKNRFKGVSLHLLMIVCLYLLSRVISSDYASIFDYSNYIYYTIGYYIAKKKDVLLSWKQPLIPYLTALMVFLLMSFFWYRNSAAIPSQYNEVFKSVLSSKPYIYGTAVIGSFFSLMHFYIWGGVNLLSFLGKETLGIYVIHQTIVHILELIPTVYTDGLFHTVFGAVICVIVLLTSALLIIRLFNLSRLLSLAFLGNRTGYNNKLRK